MTFKEPIPKLLLVKNVPFALIVFFLLIGNIYDCLTDKDSNFGRNSLLLLLSFEKLKAVTIEPV